MSLPPLSNVLSVRAVTKVTNIAKRGIGRFGVSSIFDQVIFGGTNFVTAVLIGRLASASELGTYTLCFSILMLAMSLQRAVLISAYIIVRDHLDAHQTRTMRGSILLTTCVGGVVLAILSFVAMVVPGVTVGLALTMMIVLPAGLLRDFARRMAIAELKLSMATLIDSVICVLQFLLLGVLIFTDNLSATTALLACSVVWATVGTIGLMIVRADYLPSLVHVQEDLARLWPIGRWVGLTQLIMTAQMFAIPWVMASAHSMKLAGIYAAAGAFLQVVAPAIDGLGNVLSPAIAKNAHDHAWTELRHNIGAATAIFAVIMLGLTLLCAIGGRQILGLLYGSEFSQYFAILVALSVAMTATNVGIPAMTALNQLGQAQLCFWIGLLGFLVTVVTVVIFLNAFGEIGPAYGFAVGAALTSTIRWLAYLGVEKTFRDEERLSPTP